MNAPRPTPPKPSRRGALDLLLLAFLALAGAAGCASSTMMTDVWRDPSYTGSVDRVLVVAVRHDPVRRRMWEDAFVSELSKRGMSATPSYQIFPDVPDTNQIADAVRDKNFGAVLASERLTSRTERTYVPGAIVSEPVTRYNRRYGMYQTYYVAVHEPGYVETTQLQRFRTDLWNTANGGQMIWSGTAEAPGSLDATGVQHSVAHAIVPALEKSGFIPKRR